jgi:hypothetical protein
VSALGVVTRLSKGIPGGGWALLGAGSCLQSVNQQGFGDAGGAVFVQLMLCQEKVTAKHGGSVGAHPVETFGFAGFQRRH